MTEAILITLCTLNLLALAGLVWMAKTKLVPALNSLRGLTQPKAVMGPFAPDNGYLAKSTEDKTVILLTPEHDAKVLGDEDAE